MLQSPSVLSHQTQIGSAGLDAAYARQTQAGAPKLLSVIGRQTVKTQRCGWEYIPQPPNREKTGEKLKWQKQHIAFLINEGQQTVKFHSIWRSSGWEVFKAASPFSAIWCH